jgi:hypothetical protein
VTYAEKYAIWERLEDITHEYMDTAVGKMKKAYSVSAVDDVKCIIELDTLVDAWLATHKKPTEGEEDEPEPMGSPLGGY